MNVMRQKFPYEEVSSGQYYYLKSEVYSLKSIT